MEIYRFKCKCCGATRYKKPAKNIYRCLYCGEQVEVYRKTDEDQDIVRHEETSIAPTAFETKKIEKPVPQLETHNLMMLIWCIIGGWFGLHKFMSGKILWGIVYLCTYGVMGIGIFIDAMIYLIDFSKDYKKYHRELKDFEK